MTRILHFRTLAPLLITLLVGLAGCERAANTYDPPPPPEVTVAHPVEKKIISFFDQNGETEAVDEADVRARVKGFIEEIRFEPGDPVQAGDLLYRIERNTYEAQVRSDQAAVESAIAAIGVAQAQVRNAEADLARATADYEREKRLLEGNAGSQADYDRALAESESAKAAIESAKATVEAASAEKGRAEARLAQSQLDLGYTEVVAPISGRITKTKVKKGNLVDNGDHLATVINHETVFANFNISDRQMLEFEAERLAQLEEGEELEEPDWSDIKVLLRRETDPGFPFTGHLDYIDQTGIDPDTGTLALRAVFTNDGLGLLPGMFVTVRVPIGENAGAILIPELALNRDQRGFYVLVVNDQNLSEQVRVTVGERISGWAVITSGLDPSMRVIVDGLQRALPGTEVNPAMVELDVDEETLLRGMEAVAPRRGDEDVDEDTGDAASETDEN